MPIPDALTVQIGWEDSPGGIFVLDGSELDSADVLAGLGADQFTGTYDDVSTDVSDGPRIKIGRDTALANFEASSCEFTLHRPGSPDFYNPNAVAGQSPLAGLTPGFEPMRPVRVTVAVAAVDTVVWYGYIRSAAWDSESQRCRIQAEDLFLWLSRVRPTYTSPGALSAADAIGFLLTEAGFTNPTLRDLGEIGKEGITLTLPAQTTPDKTALQLVAEILNADRGAFWIQGGVATYRARTYKYERNSLATVQSDALRIGSGLDLDRIVNRQTVTRTGGTAQQANDFSSQQRYGLADGSAVESEYLASDFDAGELATFILRATSQPQPPITLDVDNDTDTNLARQVAWKVLDRITAPVAYSEFVFGGDDNPAAWPNSLFGGTAGFGGTQDYHIERIEQDWDLGGNYVESTYTLSRRGDEFARFDSMRFDETDAAVESSAVFGY
jgi:hypothetical protein